MSYLKKNLFPSIGTLMLHRISSPLSCTYCQQVSKPMDPSAQFKTYRSIQDTHVQYVTIMIALGHFIHFLYYYHQLPCLSVLHTYIYVYTGLCAKPSILIYECYTCTFHNNTPNPNLVLTDSVSICKPPFPAKITLHRTVAYKSTHCQKHFYHNIKQQ